MNAKDLAILVALLAPMSAVAQGAPASRDWYVGVDYGQSHLDAEDPEGFAIDRDYNSDAVAIRFGYRFSRYFALEAGYVDIGDFSASYGPRCPSCSPFESESSIDGFLLNAIGTWPISGHFQLQGAIGATYRELDTTVTYPGTTNSWSDRNTIFNFTAGIGIPVTDRFEVDIAYTHYREIGLGLTLSSDVGVINEAETSLVTLGLRFRF